MVAIGLGIWYMLKRRKITPLIRIDSLSELTGCEIYGKAEFMNIGGSSKDRIAHEIIAQAELNGFKSTDVIYEGTVGSTGISLATICNLKGYNCHIFMPDDQAKEKYIALESLGAKVTQVKPCSIIDPNHYVNLARAEAAKLNTNESKGWFANQFDNLANFNAHFKTTGPEIYNQTGSRIDAFVMGAGTGGTLAGVSAFLKSKLRTVKCILADPEGSGLYNKVKFGVMYSSHEAEGTRKRHQVDSVVEGVGINRMTENFKLAIPFIDDAIQVTDKEALAMSRHLKQRDGIFIGSSSAVNCVAAYKVAKALGPGHVIVTILCDHGSRHTTKFWLKYLK